MRLISLEIQGFKSFAPRTHLQFGPGVTGVIGPNGSGKSNIAEAIRWVLGEQSMKTLRGKDRVDVIYSGDGAQSETARVTLTFDNQSGRFPIPTGEIAVSRMLSRDGESQYMINNEPVRLVDLQQMLAEAGIGAKSYTVISQGMIDTYLTANPEGRRELFDEATGIKSLQIKIAQSQQKIKKSTEHAAEVRTILEEIAPRLAFLKRQIDRYDERDAHMVLFQTKQLTYFHAAWQKSARTLEDAKHALVAIQERIATTRTTRIDAEKRAIQSAAHEHPTQRLQQELAAAHSQYVLALEQWKQREKEKQELEQSIARMRTEQESLEKELAKSTPAADTVSVLQSCKKILEKLLQGKTPALPAVESLIQLIDTAIAHPREKTPDNSPVIALTRLRAIIEERENRLAHIPADAKPSDERFLELQKQLAAIPPEHADQNHDISNAEHARDAELAAEREGAALEEKIAQYTQEHQELTQEIMRECGSKELERISTTPTTEHSTVTEDELRRIAAKIASIGERDPLIAKEYEETQERYQSMQDQLTDVEDTIEKIQQSIDELTSTMTDNFDRQFTEIKNKFSTYFTSLFGGGSAELTSTEQGIEITVVPPGKRARHVTLLSGGERALTSIALLFAILDTQKPPFIVLDEVDAALDEANSHRFATLLRERAQNTQSIVISHNRETMSQSDMLYGVTMHENGVSSIYSVKISDYTA